MEPHPRPIHSRGTDKANRAPLVASARRSQSATPEARPLSHGVHAHPSPLTTQSPCHSHPKLYAKLPPLSRSTPSPSLSKLTFGRDTPTVTLKLVYTGFAAMAVASSASVSQITASVARSSFVGSSRSLQASPVVSFGVRNVSRVVAMATKKFSAKPSGGKKSWIPAVKGGGSLVDPEWLDGSLTGDYGFDPLGLGRDPSSLKWYREAELIHGRWAMAAVVGILIGQGWSGVPWFEAGAEPSAVAPFSFGSLLGTQLLLMGWVETKRWIDFLNPGTQAVEWATPWSRTAENFNNSTGVQGYPGGKFFDPLAFAGSVNSGQYVPDFSKLERLQLAEIKHARLAMVAMLIFFLEAGQGLTPLTPLGL